MIKNSGYLSLIIQLITGIVDIYGLQIKVPKNKQIFREILKIELVVQAIEFIYYIWMVTNIQTISNITPTRYVDWVITTPTMLITLMAFLDSENSKDVKTFIHKNSYDILEIILLNLLMLLFGLAGELNEINIKTSVLLGFIPFMLYFKMIHDKFINESSTKTQKGMFYFFFIVWSLYGISALLPYEEKNIFYNILDLFAKNFLGILLVYILYTNRVKNDK